MPKAHSLINLKNKQGINELERLLLFGIARPGWNSHMAALQLHQLLGFWIAQHLLSHAHKKGVHNF